MAETDLELQLRVWKELAVSKQILMRAATDALKLDPNCTQQELKVALEAALKRSAEADTEITRAQNEAKAGIAAIEKKLADTQKSLAAAEAAHKEAVTSQQKLQQQIAELQTSSTNEANTLKERFAQKERDLQERLAQKERELKSINTLLSDTPQNVAKKLKALKKQKMDESDARKQAEEHAATLRQEKKKLEQTIKDMEAAQDKAAQLATRYRELHTLCGTFHDQLKPLVEDAKSLPAVPMLDTALVEGIEKVGEPEQKKTAAKGKR